MKKLKFVNGTHRFCTAICFAWGIFALIGSFFNPFLLIFSAFMISLSVACYKEKYW